MRKRNTFHRVSMNQKINGAIALEMRKKCPRFSIEVDRKKEQSKKMCRQKNGDFYFFE